jgi:hypothetical protein
VARIRYFTLHTETADVLEMMINYYKNKGNYFTEKANRKLYKNYMISYHIWKQLNLWISSIK